MVAAGTVSELYTDPDKGERPENFLATTPPAPPSPVPTAAPPAPTPAHQRKMFDEDANGSIRDTSTEALRPGNALQFQTFDEPKKEEPPTEPKKEETPPPPAPQAAPPAPQPEKLYAGKFKTPEELEKSYLEAQRKITETSQKAAELEKKVQTTPPPPPAPKTAAELAAEEKQRNEFLEKLVANPQGVIKEINDKAIRETIVALQAQEMTNKWRQENPDLVEHEFYVSAEMFKLTQSDPELAKDPVKLQQTATSNWRQLTGKIRTDGAKEALTTETRVTPLLSNTAPTPATEQPAKAPLTADEAYNLTMQMLKKEEQRTHRGLRR